MIEEITNTSRKISEINITNRELVKLIRYEEVFNYVTNLHECRSKNPDKNDQFTNCVLSSVCPHQTEEFKNCIKKNKNNSQLCLDPLLDIQNCMKIYTNAFISVIQNSNKF
jgi:pantothenate kinase type III